MRIRTIVTATAIAGTLDLLSAFVFSGMSDIGPTRVLQGVASGPFGDGMRDAGIGGAALGLVVHYAIMSVMAATYVTAAARMPALNRRPLLWGALYGLLLYAIMYWIVLPLRFPAVFPRTDAWSVANALFSHIVCVGIPIALVASGWPRRRAARSV